MYTVHVAVVEIGKREQTPKGIKPSMLSVRTVEADASFCSCQLLAAHPPLSSISQTVPVVLQHTIYGPWRTEQHIISSKANLISSLCYSGGSAQSQFSSLRSFSVQTAPNGSIPLQRCQKWMLWDYNKINKWCEGWTCAFDFCESNPECSNVN